MAPRAGRRSRSRSSWPAFAAFAQETLEDEIVLRIDRVIREKTTARSPRSPALHLMLFSRQN